MMDSRSFPGVSRTAMRRACEEERRRRRVGDWGPWEHIRMNRMPPHMRGWAAEMRLVWKNAVFCVLGRDVETSWGTVRHLMISSLSEDRPTWPEAQRIKDDLAGPEATAVEVYPPSYEVVDDANAYHLWVLPHPLPFTLQTATRPKEGA
jgi:hypothetical protein